jgi:membrane associated rhomboid family serine protease
VNKDRKLLQTLYENFTLSIANWQAGRSWTLLTSAFSHTALVHFFFNMFALSTFSTIIAAFPGIGAAHMLALCMGSGIAGSFAWLYEKTSGPGGRQNAMARSHQAALGASGMVMGAAAVATCLMPAAPMYIMFIPIPIPLWATTLLFAGVDAYFLHSERSPIGHSAHLGGGLFGAMFYVAFLRRFGGVGRWLGRR